MFAAATRRAQLGIGYRLHFEPYNQESDPHRPARELGAAEVHRRDGRHYPR